MAKRQIQFTKEQIEILLKNPNVESISSNTIRFTSEFKELAMQKDKEGITALQANELSIDFKEISAIEKYQNYESIKIQKTKTDFY